MKTSANNSQVVLVSGASTGIGLDTAMLLSERGYRVFGTSRKSSDQFDHLPFAMLQMDVLDEASINSGVKKLIEQTGRLDAVVCNAGFALMGPMEETAKEQAQQVFNTNVVGVMSLIQACMPHLKARKNSKVIAISSIGSEFGLPFRGLYSASKAGLENMLESFQYEVEPMGISVSIVQPGDVKTSIGEHRAIAAYHKKDSIYQGAFERAAQHINHKVETGMSPRRVSNTVLSILAHRKPPFRVPVGHWVQRWAIKANHLLPYRMFQWIIKTYMKFE